MLFEKNNLFCQNTQILLKVYFEYFLNGEISFFTYIYTIYQQRKTAKTKVKLWSHNTIYLIEYPVIQKYVL